MASAASQTAWLPPKGIHNITIGSSIRRSLSKDNSAQHHPPQPLRNDFVAMRYNLKPPGVANAAGSLVSSGSYASKESFQLDLSAETGERHSFSARSETKKEVDCVLFYDAATGTLVLERLDSLLSLTHQRSTSSSLQNNVQDINNGPPPNRPSPTAAVVPATAFPPTPPSTSPPEYTSLPESIRSIPTPRVARTDPNHEVDSASHLTTQITDKDPNSTSTTLHAAATTPASASPAPSSSRKTPQSMSEYAQEQRRLHESRPYPPKRSTTSDFASEPDEEIFTFGSKPILPPSSESSSNSNGGDTGMPSSNNALRLSDIPSRRAKRKFSDSEPDEEVLEFGRPAQEIKRAKTSSPASISHGTPAHVVAESPGESALSPHSRSLPYQSIPSRSSAAYGTKLVHGSSPLATAAVLSSNSGSEDDDSDDSDFEEVMPSFVPGDNEMVTAHGGDMDADEDDFLAAAFNNDETMALQDDAGSNHSDDSSDGSDYDER